MDMGEVKSRYRVTGISQARRIQAERVKAYKEAMDSAALAKEKYETVKMEATVKAFVDGSKSEVNIKKYMTDEAREIANRERQTRIRLKNEREYRICQVAVGLAAFSVLLAAYFMFFHH